MNDPIERARAAVRETLAALDEMDQADHRVIASRPSLTAAGSILDGDQFCGDIASPVLWEMRRQAEQSRSAKGSPR